MLHDPPATATATQHAGPSYVRPPPRDVVGSGRQRWHPEGTPQQILGVCACHCVTMQISAIIFFCGRNSSTHTTATGPDNTAGTQDTRGKDSTHAGDAQTERQTSRVPSGHSTSSCVLCSVGHACASRPRPAHRGRGELRGCLSQAHVGRSHGHDQRVSVVPAQAPPRRAVRQSRPRP